MYSQVTVVPPDPWTAAIHQSRDDRRPLGVGVVIDQRRVLTCAHVLRYDRRWRDDVWVAFPKAPIMGRERRRVVQYDKHDSALDLVVLELAEPVPAGVTPARIRCVPATALTGQDWWAFGFPGGNEAGDEARGTVGPPLAYGQVRLDTTSRHQLERGFSGSGVWLPEYAAVVGLVVAAASGSAHHGNGHALTIHQADLELPELDLSASAGWSVEAADEIGLAAWGWALRADLEAGRHWLPRGRGVAGPDEPGYRFRGRTEALTELVRCLDRPVPDGRVLVVTGSPGVGKSAVLGRVVTTADSELRHLLPADDAAVRASVGSIACAVHAKGKTALDVAREIARAASVSLPESAEDLVAPLRAWLTERRRRFNLVVDALDEAASPEQARRLVHAVLLPIAGLAPDLDVQVVIGTRRSDDAGDLIGAFEGRTSVIDLDDPDYFAEPDLVAYVTATLRLATAERDGNPYADPAAARPVAERIAALAGRNFLVAGLVGAAHGRSDTEPVDLDKISYTPTVDAALEAYLAGLPPLGGTPARLALSVLAYAEPPGLPLPLWRAGVTALGGSATEDQLAGFARGAAANFLVETNTGPSVRAYRLFHQALGEALLRGQEAVGSRADDERRLFEAWLAHGRRTGWWAAYDYLLSALPVHAHRVGRLDELLALDRYLLHADLRRLLQVADGVTTIRGRARVRLLQRTPRAISAGPAERAAMFSVTERLDRLGSGFAATAAAPYSAQWARTPPRHERAALEGHAAGVLAVCPVPLADRSLLASAGQDGTVRLWDPTSAQPEQVLTGHTDWVRSICAIDTGGRHLLATASDDHTVRLWDPTTGQPERVLGGHPGWVSAVCPITVDGQLLLVAAGYDTMIRFWDLATGQLARALDGQTGWVTALSAVTVDGRELLATAGYDTAVHLWDPATGRLLRTLTGHTRPVTGLSTVAGLLITTSEDGTVRLWDPATGEPVKVLEGHTDWVRAACPTTVAGRPLVVSAGDDGTVRLWDPDTGQPERVIEGTGPVVGLGAVAGLLASTGQDGTVRLWHRQSGQSRASLTGHTAPVTSLCTIPVDQHMLLASASEDWTIRLWDPATGQAHRTLDGDHAAVSAVCAVPVAGRHLLASASDTLRLWDPTTGQIERVLGHLRWVTAVCTVPVDGRQLLASADEDGVVRLWDPATGTLERELRCHHSATTALCAIPVGGRHLLVSASQDHTILLWEPESGNRVWALHGHAGSVTGLCVVPARDGHLLASTSDDRTVRLWDPATGTVRLTIPVYHRALACCYVSGTLVIGLDTGMLAVELDGRRVSGRR